MAGAQRHDDGRAGDGRMHTTTVRFGGETWETLKAHAEADGVATAQYIREAVIARMARDDALDQVRGELHAELGAVGELRARVTVIESALRRLLGPRRR